KLATAVTGADYYLEVRFAAGAGSVAAGGNTGEIQNRFSKTDWTNYNEANDYSFDPTKTAYADWSHVTLYRNGALVWGTEPGGASTPTPTATTASTATATARPTATTGATATATPRPTATSGATATATARATATSTATPSATATVGPTPTNP